MKNKIPPPLFEFHISRKARDRYAFEDALFASSGNVILADFHAARRFAHQMNNQRDLLRFPEQTVRAGQINAMGLIDEILHVVVHLYREQVNPSIMIEALAQLDEALGREKVDDALRRFTDAFPTVAVYRNRDSAESWLAGETGGFPNRAIALEEMLLLWLANMNPAFSPFLELFDHSDLAGETVYTAILKTLKSFFDARPFFGPDHQNLIDMLRSPAVVIPHSLPGQLEYIRTRWGFLLGKYLYRLLGAQDLLREEEKAFLWGGGGPGPSRAYDFRHLGMEPERFSPDREWMPQLVLMAKNTYVWLYQLSRQYGRDILRLDQIPDEELDILARRGFTGLWLIGLWERSKASQKIKQLCGNPEAVASAYSLYDYRIADDLGGEPAYQNLKERAWQRGIRLASDMVPNHMSIDSRWVVEHPDWFIGLDDSPFPSYSFSGQDVSTDSRVGVFIEDHYYSRSDAAVVFKRLDRYTGSVRYIYHGNDGTSMPWNDTAQLNYLNPEVREAVIRTILHVARRFPVIRFDAAMTLAKKHYHRLWVPEPGSGGAIPSRAEHGMTRERFDGAMPEEFWREVVDRVAKEAPDTLLLAEAFWLMEGYFVRTLGMHRVYNSAFMNMLRDEDNAKYRLVIKNTLEFDPEILKRYVNFMNNPDERTAVDQFGDGDKYFGICVLMSTLPGLPMFGHGQIEGFREKYGMEYRRPYMDEHPDGHLVWRHEKEISPLLHKRPLFAGVEHFLLYDFTTPEGPVNEDVFAYSNRMGEDRGLVIFHNRYARTSGWIKMSAAYLSKSARGRRHLARKSLSEGLELKTGNGDFIIFRDQAAGLEYIRNGRELWEKGLYIELAAYQYHVFTDFRQVRDSEWHPYSHLADYLSGRGVPSIDEAMKEIVLQPLHQAFKELADPDLMRRLFAARVTRSKQALNQGLMDETKAKVAGFLGRVRSTVGSGDAESLTREILAKLEAILNLPVFGSRTPIPAPVAARLKKHLSHAKNFQALLGYCWTHLLGKMLLQDGWKEQSYSWIDEWLLGKILTGSFRDSGLSEPDAWKSLAVIKILIRNNRWFEMTADPDKPGRILELLLSDPGIQQFIRVNRYQDELWFNKEAFEELLNWLLCIAAVESGSGEIFIGSYRILQQFERAERKSGYRLEKLLEAAAGSRIKKEPSKKRPGKKPVPKK
ncbi:alpha-amylase [bacterium]|nr:alpha-amylase [bacterium]